MNIRVEQANISHIDPLTTLFDDYRIFYGKESNLEKAKQFLIDRIYHQQSTVFIALDDMDNGAGFTQLYPSFSSVSMQGLWILNDLFVNENYRRQGVGKMLMDWAKMHAIQTNAKGLVLETQLENKEAQRLYESLGYVKSEDYYVYNLTL